MASRTMHLAIADKLIKTVKIDDVDRFRLGCVLPDAYRAGMGTAHSHFKTRICGGTKFTYRLAEFRERYSDRLFCDSLYLGYYMHLVQDMLFRHFVYDVHRWDPVPQGNVDRLHNDYRLLNTYIVEHYNVAEKLILPRDIYSEDIMTAYPFDLEQLLRDFERDLIPYTEGTVFFFSEDMTDDYIALAAQKCAEEIKALRCSSSVIDEKEYAWDVHT